ncbi:hypothetical protein ABZX40_30940 [Streptomyces sp. NPDC004610]|uniref:hypothetical protein n=1 Tax=unclassified Streptomyces TaxID=2593676 RepID=UPI0033AFF8C7
MADDESDHQAPGRQPRGAEGSWVRVVDLTFRLLMALRELFRTLLRTLRRRRRRDPEDRGAQERDHQDHQDHQDRRDHRDHGDLREPGEDLSRRAPRGAAGLDGPRGRMVPPLPGDPALRDAAVALDRARERIMAADAHQFRMAQARWERPAPAPVPPHAPRTPDHPTAVPHPGPGTDLDPFAATVADRREGERREGERRGTPPENGTETPESPQSPQSPKTPVPAEPEAPVPPPKLPLEEPARPTSPAPPAPPISPVPPASTAFVPLELPPVDASSGIGAEVTAALSPEAREFLRGTSLGSLGTGGGDSPAPTPAPRPRTHGTGNTPNTPRRPGRR